MSLVTDQREFNDLYWNSKSPDVRRLRETHDWGEAFSLANKGFVIDVPIMVYAFDPFWCMSDRAAYGYTWVPSALQPPVKVAPGLGVPGLEPYDPLHPPLGSIKVSLDSVDYPPFDPPPQPEKPHDAAIAVLGRCVPGIPENDPSGWGRAYNVAAWYPLDPVTGNDGASETYPQLGTFKMHATRNPFGWARYWEKVG